MSFTGNRTQSSTINLPSGVELSLPSLPIRETLKSTKGKCWTVHTTSFGGVQESEMLERSVPGNQSFGTHGSFTLPIIKDESGSLTSVFLLSERAAAGDYTEKPGGDTGRWVLELVGAMNNADGRTTDPGPNIDKTSYDTALRALSTKVGLGTPKASLMGYSDPEIIYDLGTGLTSPGTINEKKNITISLINYDKKLDMDGSNMPKTEIDHSKGDFRVFPILCKPEDTLDLIDRLTEGGCEVDVPVTTLSLMLASSGQNLLSQIQSLKEKRGESLTTGTEEGGEEIISDV